MKYTKALIYISATIISVISLGVLSLLGIVPLAFLLAIWDRKNSNPNHAAKK